jgi:vancomycin resistance protein YoaR
MSEKYYQEYGPIRRRRSKGQIEPEPPRDRKPPEREPKDPAPRKRGRRGFSLLGLLLLAIGVIVVYVALPYGTNAIAAGSALRGVSLQGQPIGGLNETQIRAALRARYNDFLRTPVTIVFEDRSWNPTPAEIGVQLDIDASVADILAIGRRGDARQRVSDIYAIYRQGGVDVAPRLKVDMPTLQRYLTMIAAEFEYPPQDAALSLAAGRVLPTPARPGRQVLVDETMIDIVRTLQTLAPQTVALRTRTLDPALSDEEIAAAVEYARATLSEPLILREGDRSWTWDQERLAEMVAVTVVDGSMVAEIDPDRLARAVEKLAQVVDSPSVEPRVTFRDGRLRIAEEGRTGTRLQQEDAVEQIARALRFGRHIVELPMEEVTPQITAESLDTLGIVELVAEGKSSFAGSAPYRITNIEAGAARMNGVLIPPGAEFSFNTQLGAVDESNGFVQGYAVIGNRTQLEWGGGVCQVSTTVFRSAFWAGLPITERHAHPFYISWYDPYSFPDAAAPGMDATIYTGVQDFKFANDTGNWLLMETVVDTQNAVLTVRLYGANPNDRRVRISGPQIDNIVQPPSEAVYTTDPSLPAGAIRQTDTARRGMDIAVYRVISENGVERDPELFFTRFRAWPDVFVRGTG